MLVETIAKRLNITVEQAATIKGIIKGNIDPEGFKSVQSWVAQCYNKPSKLELKLEAINEVLEGFGIEYIESSNDDFNDSQGLSYVNLGDTYVNTVIFDHSDNTWNYCSWGDIVEENQENYI